MNTLTDTTPPVAPLLFDQLMAEHITDDDSTDLRLWADVIGYDWDTAYQQVMADTLGPLYAAISSITGRPDVTAWSYEDAGRLAALLAEETAAQHVEETLVELDDTRRLPAIAASDAVMSAATDATTSEMVCAEAAD